VQCSLASLTLYPVFDLRQRAVTASLRATAESGHARLVRVTLSCGYSSDHTKQRWSSAEDAAWVKQLCALELFARLPTLSVLCITGRSWGAGSF
jgi:hypothetical protein